LRVGHTARALGGPCAPGLLVPSILPVADTAPYSGPTVQEVLATGNNASYGPWQTGDFEVGGRTACETCPRLWESSSRAMHVIISYSFVGETETSGGGGTAAFNDTRTLQTELDISLTQHYSAVITGLMHGWTHSIFTLPPSH
jgi:hypothetical protein